MLDESIICSCTRSEETLRTSSERRRYIRENIILIFSQHLQKYTLPSERATIMWNSVVSLLRELLTILKVVFYSPAKFMKYSEHDHLHLIAWKRLLNNCISLSNWTAWSLRRGLYLLTSFHVAVMGHVDLKRDTKLPWLRICVVQPRAHCL